MADTVADSRSLRPTDLRVEFEAEPVNVDPTEPRFAWRLPLERRGIGQTAYRLLVGREQSAVTDGRGDVWDSGRVESTGSTGVTYDGPSLASDETYYWTVAVWTEQGERTEWARPSQFSTALRSTDWRGDWITHQPGNGERNGWRGPWRPHDWTGEEWVQVDLEERRHVSEITVFPADPVGVIHTPDDVAVTESWADDPLTEFGFPNAYRIEIADDPDFETATLVAEIDRTGDEPTGEVTPRTHSEIDATGQYVRVTATDLFEFVPSSRSSLWNAERDRSTPQADPWQCFALAGVAVRDSTGTVHEGRQISASRSVESDTWSTEYLANGQTESVDTASSPLLRTEFRLDGEVERARAHLAAVGYGELHVNGERISEQQLDPAWTDYEQRVLYTTYELTDRLSGGVNALGIWLGRGWFSKRAPYWASGGSPRARLTLTVEFTDGRTRTVTTTGDWRATAGPIVENDIYDGERYDARLEPVGWRSPGFDDEEWDPSTVVDGPGGTLRPQRIESMRAVETFDVQEVYDHPDGPILDFGQNLTGWLAIEVTGASAGDEVTIRHAEALTDDGDLSDVDLRTADATDTYVARGEDSETYEPRFTYHGFRYAQILGYPGEFDPDRVTAKAVHTAMDRRGEFSCSNADLNQVQHNAVWGLRGNTHSIPEDCPQRDERFGWTGDAQISNRALLFNYDAVRFDEKWLRDHDDAASPMGYVPDVIPNKIQEDPADPTWSITRIMLPWYLYLHDGDERILEDQYEGLRAYVDYWQSVSVDGGVIPEDYGKFGDWLAFENTDGRRGLPIELFTTAFHYQAVDTFAKIAAVLGNDGDATAYRKSAERIRDTFNDRFFDYDAATYGPGTQSSYAVPLYMGLVPEHSENRVVENLVEKVESDGSQLTTGFLGTRPLIHTLAEHGCADLAYEIVSQPDRPGWVYMARNGATTMWERWDSDGRVGDGMNSLNHSPLTHVSEFFYEVLAGIQIRDRPVTEHVTIAPAMVEDLDRASATVETRNGELSTEWAREAGGYDLSVSVPFNGAATVRLPDTAAADVTESGTAIDESHDGVRSVDRGEETVTVDVKSGEYDFTVR